MHLIQGGHMFGHQDEENTNQSTFNNTGTTDVQTNTDSVAGPPPAPTSTFAADTTEQNSADSAEDTTADNTSSSAGYIMTPAPNEPAGTPSVTTADSDGDELLHIKQQALSQLSPIVDHLDQSPEEKFRTTMMMIQASDDQSLIKVAYEAAQQITDEKEKAQALLDVVNEINYFTQHTSDTN